MALRSPSVFGLRLSVTSVSSLVLRGPGIGSQIPPPRLMRSWPRQGGLSAELRVTQVTNATVQMSSRAFLVQRRDKGHRGRRDFDRIAKSYTQF